MNKCEWQQNEYGAWETGCHELFEFNEGGPSENGFVYCPYCGGELEAEDV